MADPLANPKRWLINGVVITLPIVITLLVLMVALDFILGVLSPVVTAVAYLWPDEPSARLLEALTILSLVGFFLLVGIFADLTPGEHVMSVVDETMATVPGLSVVYTSVRQARNVLVADGADQFQDVKLIEFPHEDAYMIGFLIGDAPPEITDSIGAEEAMTVMVPLGPNPTTNGFIMHMPEENVHEIDMTVEEAVQSIATLGVAEVDESGDSGDSGETKEPDRSDDTDEPLTD